MAFACVCVCVLMRWIPLWRWRWWIITWVRKHVLIPMSSDQTVTLICHQQQIKDIISFKLFGESCEAMLTPMSPTKVQRKSGSCCVFKHIHFSYVCLFSSMSVLICSSDAFSSQHMLLWTVDARCSGTNSPWWTDLCCSGQRSNHLCPADLPNTNGHVW